MTDVGLYQGGLDSAADGATWALYPRRESMVPEILAGGYFLAPQLAKVRLLRPVNSTLGCFSTTPDSNCENGPMASSLNSGDHGYTHWYTHMQGTCGFLGNIEVDYGCADN